NVCSFSGNGANDHRRNLVRRAETLRQRCGPPHLQLTVVSWPLAVLSVNRQVPTVNDSHVLPMQRFHQSKITTVPPLVVSKVCSAPAGTMYIPPSFTANDCPSTDTVISPRATTRPSACS